MALPMALPMASPMAPPWNRRRGSGIQSRITMSNHPVSLNDANFEATALLSEQPVLIDFLADWCGPCQALAPVLEELAAEFEGRAVIAKVNIDESPDLASRYGVRSIPTLVLLENGEETERIVGLTTKRVLAAKLETRAVSR